MIDVSGRSLRTKESGYTVSRMCIQLFSLQLSTSMIRFVLRGYPCNYCNYSTAIMNKLLRDLHVTINYFNEKGVAVNEFVGYG